MSVIVVGEATGNLAPGSRHATASRRLADLLAIDEETLLRNVVWVNLFDRPGTPDRYHRFIERAVVPGDCVFLLGRRVARAFDLDHLKPLDTVRVRDGATSVIVPHPSGRNRWYNDPDNLEDARLILQRLWKLHWR